MRCARRYGASVRRYAPKGSALTQAAVELSLHAQGDTKSKPGKRQQQAASFRSNGRPAPVYAAPVVPYQDPRRAPAAPQHTSLFRSLAAESRASQPSNVTPIGVFTPEDALTCLMSVVNVTAAFQSRGLLSELQTHYSLERAGQLVLLFYPKLPGAACGTHGSM